MGKWDKGEVTLPSCATWELVSFLGWFVCLFVLFLFLPAKALSFERRIGCGPRPMWLEILALTLTAYGIVDGIAPFYR